MPTVKLLFLALAACQPAVDEIAQDSTTVTLLFTNDVESAYDPIPAFWLEDQEMIGGIADDDRLLVAAPGFLAEGGDLYTVFAEAEAIRSAGKVSDAAAAWFANHDVVAVPSRGRQVDIGQ